MPGKGTTRIVLELDALDAEAIREAMARRRAFTCGLPDGESNESGALLAEICRGWCEILVPDSRKND